VDRLATLLDRTLLSPSIVLVFRFSKTDSSLQPEIPTMMEPPSTHPFLATALLACILVWNLTCIQLELGGMMCCNTVPHMESSDRMKLTEEGGNPHTVTQVSMGEWSGVANTSWGEVMVEGEGDIMLFWKLLGVETDLLGVKRRELVGGPPGLSLLDLGMEDEFSFSN